MKYLGAAIVTLGLIAADFFAHVPALNMSSNQQSLWAQWDTVGIILFVVLIAFGPNRG